VPVVRAVLLGRYSLNGDKATVDVPKIPARGGEMAIKKEGAIE
jgi:hypothetical protein